MKRKHEFIDYFLAWINFIDGPGRSYELNPSEISYLKFIGLSEWPYRAIRFAQIMLSFVWVILLPNFRDIPIWISFSLMIATYVTLSALFAWASRNRFLRKKKRRIDSPPLFHEVR